MPVDSDNVTLVARVAGNPPRESKRPLADWDKLLGELADSAFETTQRGAG